MRDFLKKLNGWQRVFIFIILIIYLPITIGRISSIDISTEDKYSINELKLKISEFLKKENITTTISIETIETDYVELAKKFGGTPFYKNEREELEALRLLSEINEKISNQNETKGPIVTKNSGLIKVRYISDNEYPYIIIFKYNKEPKLFYYDADIKKLSALIQSLINETKIKSETYIEFLKILLYFSLFTILTYFIGFMIGWVIKGFKTKHN